MSQWFQPGLYKNGWTMERPPSSDRAIISNDANPSQRSVVIPADEALLQLKPMPNPQDGEEFTLNLASDSSNPKPVTFSRDRDNTCVVTLGKSPEPSVLLALSPEAIQTYCGHFEVKQGGPRDGVIIDSSGDRPTLETLTGTDKQEYGRLTYPDGSIAFPASLNRAFVTGEASKNVLPGAVIDFAASVHRPKASAAQAKTKKPAKNNPSDAPPPPQPSPTAPPATGAGVSPPPSGTMYKL